MRERTHGAKVRLPNGKIILRPGAVTSDSFVFADDEWEFIKACGAAQAKKGKPLSPAEILRVAHKLGYRKAFAPGEVSEKTAVLRVGCN